MTDDHVPQDVEKLMAALTGAREAFGDHKFGFGCAYLLGRVFRDSPELMAVLLHVLAEGMEDDGSFPGKAPWAGWGKH